jgi:DNA-binding NtrC family response regulator
MAQSHILVVDDEPDIRYLVSEILEDEGYDVSTAENGETARTAFLGRQPDLVLLDIWMPDIDGISLLREWSAGGEPACPIVMMSGHGTLETAVEATRLGARDFVEKPLSLAKLLATVRQALDSRGRKHTPPRTGNRQQIEPIGSSPEMQLLRQRAEQAARHDSPVLISGEPGSGRELLAEHIHHLSGRPGELQILDHCQIQGARSRAYLLGEVTGDGHVPGLFERAADGTVFIPDIHALPRAAQELLIQILEAGSWVAEGGATESPITFRLLVGTASSPERLVEEGTLLKSLYYRINVLPLNVPALRTRPGDIPELVRFYADWYPNQADVPYRPFSIAALNRLRNHAWPGNTQELRNVVQRILILGGEGEVSAQEVEITLQQHASEGQESTPARPGSFDLPLREAREQFEREYLEYQLRKAGGSVGKLSESVGMERTHLYRKLRALGIDPKSVGRDGDST